MFEINALKATYKFTLHPLSQVIDTGCIQRTNDAPLMMMMMQLNQKEQVQFCTLSTKQIRI